MADGVYPSRHNRGVETGRALRFRLHGKCWLFLRKHNVKQDTVSEERNKYLKEKLSVEPSREMANNICAKTKREWRELR